MTIVHSAMASLAAVASLTLPVAVTATTMPPAANTAAVSGRPNGPEPELVSRHRRERTDHDWLPARVVVGWGGRVTVVWQRPAANGDGGFRAARLMASARGPRGSWSKPVAVSERYDTNDQTWDVAAGSGRHVTLVWTVGTGEGRTVHEAHTDGGAWSSPTALGPGAEPRVAVDGAGNASVVWTDDGVVLATRHLDGTWTSQHFAAPPGIPSYPGPVVWRSDIAVNRAGATVAMWSVFSQDPPYGYAAYRPEPGVAWSAPDPLPDLPLGNNGPGLAVDRAGHAVAAWTGHDEVWWTRRGADTGSWSPLSQVPGDVGVIDDYGGIRVVLDDAGRGILSWWAESGSYVARWNADTGAGRAVRLMHGDRWFSTVGDPMLKRSGKAFVAGLARGAEPRVGFYRSRSGRSWAKLASPATARRVGDATARGGRMAVVYGNSRGLFVLVRG